VAEDRTLAEIERKRGREFAAGLSMPVLSRTWQMLLKGIAEVKDAARPIAAAEMVLVRIAYAAHLPSPEEAIRSLADIAQRPGAPGRGESTSPSGAPARSPVTAHAGDGREGMQTSARYTVSPSPALPARDPVGRGAARPATAQTPAVGTALAPAFVKFTDLIAFVGAQRDVALKAALERDVRLVRFEDGKLEIALEPSASRALIGDLGRRLSALTGRRWMVVVSAEAGEATVRSQLDARREEFTRGVQADPLVRSVLAKFPGAEIVAVRQPEREAMPPPVTADDDEPPLEMPIDYGEADSAFGAHGRPDDGDYEL